MLRLDMQKDLELVMKLCGEVGHKSQRTKVLETYAALISRVNTLELVDFFIHGRDEVQHDVSPARVMRTFGKIASKDVNERTGRHGWWHEILPFVREISTIQSQQIFGDLPILQSAYEARGVEAFSSGILDLLKVIDTYEMFPTSYQVMMGRNPTEPYYYAHEKLKEQALTDLDTVHLGSTAKTIRELHELEAPEELCLLANNLVRREREGGRRGWLFPNNISRFKYAGREEREYMQAMIETDKIWEGATIDSFEQKLKDPTFYGFLRKQIERGASFRQIRRVRSFLEEIEQHSEIVAPLTYVLTGEKGRIPELLRYLHSQPFDFIRDTPSCNTGIPAQSLLPGLLSALKKHPNEKVIEYFRRIVSSGANPAELDVIFEEFSPYEDSKGKRSAYSNDAIGKRFRENSEKHQPRIEAVGENAKSINALKILYDSASGLEHQIVVGAHNEDKHECTTTSFVNGDGIMHAIFPHSMMIDPRTNEADCNGCSSYKLCFGMEEYTSAVLFDPEEFDPSFLEALAKTIPGTYELQRNENGIHGVASFMVVPKKMQEAYLHPTITKKETPVLTERSLPNMVVFPFNMKGSAYFARSLRTHTMGKEIECVNEDVETSKEEWGNSFEEVQARMQHLTGRRIQVVGSESQTIYHPSLTDFNLERDLGIRYVRGKTFTITPVGKRKIN